MSDSATSEKRRIPLYNIHPGANPRKDFGDLDGLAAAIRATGGNPINPIVVVEDGTYDGEPQYRLVDGERRWRAMQLLHKTADWETDALVFHSYREADEAIAMVATDDKKTLTDTEIATGFQQMIQLNVAEETMANALHRNVDEIRRARRVAKTTSIQATLDQLIAAAEFEEEEDRAKILSAEPNMLSYTVSNVRRAAETRERMRDIVDIADVYGIPINDQRPDEGYEFVEQVTSADQLMERLTDDGFLVDDGAIMHAGPVLAPGSWNGGPTQYYTLLYPRRERTEEEIEVAKEREANIARISRMNTARNAFVKSLLCEVALYGGERYKALRALAGRTRQISEWESGSLRQALAETLKDEEAAERTWKIAETSPASDCELVLWVWQLRSHTAESVRDAMEIAEADGYTLSDEDRWYIAQADEMAKEEEEGDDEEDEGE
jgi:ParB-like chromosome segregation protein Spo0J